MQQNATAVGASP